MRTELCFDFTPPSDWLWRCVEHTSLFHDPAWHRVLQHGFNARTLYVWEQQGDTAFSVNIFKAGPFRIGYLGFPIGGSIGSPLTQRHLDALRRVNPPFDLLRIPVSGFGPQLETNLNAVAVPETAVTELAQWELSALPKLRRDLNKARHTDFTIRDLKNDEQHGAALYDLYCNTVVNKGGNLRYTPAYFQAILELTSHCPKIRCIGAFHEQDLTGFVVVLLDGHIGYYLHGATASTWKTKGVSDLLVYTSLEWAKHKGMVHFNLMSSPPSQPGLIRYKEKFGAKTQINLTYEAPFSSLRARLFKASIWLHARLKHL